MRSNARLTATLETFNFNVLVITLPITASNAMSERDVLTSEVQF